MENNLTSINGFENKSEYQKKWEILNKENKLPLKDMLIYTEIDN